jgi:hypothetical protein
MNAGDKSSWLGTRKFLSLSAASANNYQSDSTAILVYLEQLQDGLLMYQH